MSQYVLFALLGLGTGALYAMLAQGITITARAAGVLNLGHGALAMMIAYVYAGLRADGTFALPPLPNPLVLIEWLLAQVSIDIDVPKIPTFVDLGGPLGAPAAMALCAVVAVAVGALVHLLVFRPLRYSSPLAKMVAGLGLMLAVQAYAGLRYGPEARRVPSSLPSGTVDVAGGVVPVDRLVLAGIAVIICIGLIALMRFTRFGLASEAAAHDESSAIMSGLSPDRLALWTWIISVLIAGAAGVLASPMTTLTPTNYTLFVIPALVAALAGRLRSLAVVTAAGLAIGMLQSMTLPLRNDVSWLPSTGLAETVPLIAVAAVLAVTGGRARARGSSDEARLPPLARSEDRPRTVFLVGAIVIVAAILFNFEVRAAITSSTIGFIVAASVVVITGYVGQISLMPLTFAGVAAFAMAQSVDSFGVPTLVAWAFGMAAALVTGLIAGLPALRSRSFEFAVITIAAAYAFQELVLNNQSLVGHLATTGTIESPSFGPLRFGPNDPFFISGRGTPTPGFTLFAVIVAVVVALGVGWLRKHRLGRAMLAVRTSEPATSALGVSPSATKLWAFLISATIAGIGGCLMATRVAAISPTSFTVMASVSAFAIAYLGGITSLRGAAQAAVLWPGGIGFYIGEQFFDAGRYQEYVSGITLIIIAAVAPGGLASMNQEIRHRRELRRARRATTDEHTIDEQSQPEPSTLDGVRPLFEQRSPARLRADGVSVTFGVVTAVEDVSVTVDAGSLTGLIGSNGAGKTTFIDALTAEVDSTGDVWLGDQLVNDAGTTERARDGLIRTFQQASLFADLTVAENLLVASDKDPISASELQELLVAFELDGLADRRPDQLSLGQQRLASVARALAARPKVLLLDEPAAGLDEHERDSLMLRLREISTWGIVVLIVDHDVDLVFSNCERVLVLEGGVLIADSTPDEVRRSPEVIAAYLGHSLPTPEPV